MGEKMLLSLFALALVVHAEERYQGLVADGEDRSHWVIVDDRGFGDCKPNSEDDIYCYHEYDYQYCCQDVGCDRSTVTPINSTRFCGFCTCVGLLDIHCSMEFGCHG